MAVIAEFDFGKTKRKGVKRQPHKKADPSRPVLSHQDIQSLMNEDKPLPQWQLVEAKPLSCFPWKDKAGEQHWMRLSYKYFKLKLVHIKAIPGEFTFLCYSERGGCPEWKVTSPRGFVKCYSDRVFAEYGPHKFGEELYQRIISEVKG